MIKTPNKVPRCRPLPGAASLEVVGSPSSGIMRSLTSEVASGNIEASASGFAGTSSPWTTRESASGVARASSPGIAATVASGLAETSLPERHRLGSSEHHRLGLPGQHRLVLSEHQHLRFTDRHRLLHQGSRQLPPHEPSSTQRPTSAKQT